MYNEIFGIASFIVTFALMVLMYRCFGKQGLIAWVAIGTIIANIQVIKSSSYFWYYGYAWKCHVCFYIFSY